MRKIITFIISILDIIFPKFNRAVFSSFPDFTDNSYALFLYLYKNKELNSFIWLVSNSADVEQSYIKLSSLLGVELHELSNVVIKKKNTVSGIYYYLSSKYVFFTHGLFPNVKISKSHIVVNLWHGMPLKKICYFDNPDKKDVPYSTFNVATSLLYQDVIAKAFNVSKKQVVCSGQPRNDLLFGNIKDVIEINSGVCHILWTPTYRKARIGYFESDGQFQSGFPIIGNDLSCINELLIKYKGFLTIKLHPMDVLNDFVFETYSNIKILNDTSFEAMHIQVNELLTTADVLLTDFSSIYIDYLLLERPIGFVIDDFEQYNDSRGFVFNEPLNYMPGMFIDEKSKLKKFLIDSMLGIDLYKDERKKVNLVLNNSYKDSSLRLWNQISEEI